MQVVLGVGISIGMFVYGFGITVDEELGRLCEDLDIWTYTEILTVFHGLVSASVAFFFAAALFTLLKKCISITFWGCGWLCERLQNLRDPKF